MTDDVLVLCLVLSSWDQLSYADFPADETPASLVAQEVRGLPEGRVVVVSGRRFRVEVMIVHKPAGPRECVVVQPD